MENTGAKRNARTVGTAAGPLAGQVFMITGSTDGIGKHTAQQLAKQSASVIVHGRTRARVEDTVNELRRIGGGGDVAGYTRDLASLAEVRRLAEDVTRDFERIDVLINNAGVYEQSRRLSEDGHELTWAVNVLAPFVLTHALLGVISRRIVHVSSISAASSIDWDNLEHSRRYSAHSAYALSKLAMQMMTVETAERLAARGVTVNTLDPGTVNTKMLLAGWGPCGIEVGDANDEFWLSTSPDIEGVTGQYYVSQRQRSPGGPAKDKAARLKLFDILEAQGGVQYPAAS